jgi:hypothetical protein
LIGNSRSRFATRACVAVFGLFISSLPGFSQTGTCGFTKQPSPYIKYDIKGKILSLTLILDDGIEYPCNPNTIKYQNITNMTCGPLVLGETDLYVERGTGKKKIDLYLMDKNKKVFLLETYNDLNEPDKFPKRTHAYRSDAVVSTEVDKWRLRDTDKNIRLRKVVECPAKYLPIPSL